MEASTITEHLSPPMYSDLLGEAPRTDIEAEYTMLPPNGVFTNMNMEGRGDSFHIGGPIFQAADSGHDALRILGYNPNGMECAYSGYAPSQAYGENCSSLFFENGTVTGGGKPVRQNGADTLNQSRFPYSRNAAALAAFHPQGVQDVSTYMMCPAYKVYRQNSQNSQWYMGMQQPENGFPFGYQQSPLQSETTYSSNFRFLHGKGNNFNHFPNRTNMDLVFPRGANESYCYAKADSSLLGQNKAGSEDKLFESIFPHSARTQTH